MIIYNGNSDVSLVHKSGIPAHAACYKTTLSYSASDTLSKGCGLSFKFYGTKFSIISIMCSSGYRYSQNIQVKIDGQIVSMFSEYHDPSYIDQRLVYEKQILVYQLTQ